MRKTIGCVEKVWSHEAVVGNRMVFCEVIGKIVCPRPPVGQKLHLVGPVLDPTKMHVDCLRSFLLESSVGKVVGSGVVDLAAQGLVVVDDPPSP